MDRLFVGWRDSNGIDCELSIGRALTVINSNEAPPLTNGSDGLTVNEQLTVQYGFVDILQSLTVSLS